MSILQDIYDDEYSPSRKLNKMPPSLRRKERALWDALEEAMGEDFFENHWQSFCELEEFRDYTNFREGFRLGVSLMLELL